MDKLQFDRKMKKKILFCLLLPVFGALEADNGYHYHVDLTKVQNDRVTVTLRPPQVTAQEIDFLFPAMVPGTYEVYDFGRYVFDLTVKGRDGKTVNVKKIDAN